MIPPQEFILLWQQLYSVDEIRGSIHNIIIYYNHISLISYEFNIT